MIRRIFVQIATSAVLSAIGVTVAHGATCCPFCPGASQTLTKDAEQAVMILYGQLKNAKLDPNSGDLTSGTTELIIDSIVKSHESVAGKKSIVLPRYIPPEKDTKFLVFCDFYQGKIDPYRGMAVRADSHIAEYLKGALAVKDKDATTRLRYFFQFLDYKEYRPVAEKASPETIAKWIRDPNTPSLRLGLYGSMLGHCGTAEHAKLLRELLDNSQNRYSSGVDGMLAGYILLKPGEGFSYLKSILGDNKRDFLLRYAALRATRFLHDYRPDIVKPDQVRAATATLLNQKDIADLAIEDLRKWGAWEFVDRVLGLYGRKDFDAPIIKRAILRFALSCPAGIKASEEFVAARKKEDAQYVEEVADLLRLESPRPDPVTTSSKPVSKSK
jgi:hypothetical protein